MDVDSALATIRAEPTMSNALETVQRVERAQTARDDDFKQCFGRLLREVWQLSPCRDKELMTLHAKAAECAGWGQPVFATDDEVLSYRWDGPPASQFVLEAWSELEWDHGGARVRQAPG